MNIVSLSDFKQQTRHRIIFWMRLLDHRRRVQVFSSRSGTPETLQRIHVINLDRKPDRWRQQKRELDRFRDRDGKPLSAITRRYSAVDARHRKGEVDPAVLKPWFTLADQLTVDPNPLLKIDDGTRAHVIQMSPQEIAVAMSHIEVWRLVASGDVPNALILEDDVFFPRGFASRMDAVWTKLSAEFSTEEYDLVFLSFKDVGEPGTPPVRVLGRREHPGIWQASGYVLSKRGAQKLLDRLPMHGPVDLWLNLQFSSLDVLITEHPIIEQNIGEPSTNSYSILPVLSQVGVITGGKPLVSSRKHLDGPVIVVGEPGSGLTAIAKSLSMLGYTCCSDLDSLPSAQLLALINGRRRDQLFNAFVNIGELDASTLNVIAIKNKRARFVTTGDQSVLVGIEPSRVLQVHPGSSDKWQLLINFLGMEYPTYPFPEELDLGQRSTTVRGLESNNSSGRDLSHDRSPWIMPSTNQWQGIQFSTKSAGITTSEKTAWYSPQPFDPDIWRLRHDTFPSNLSLFTAANFIPDDPARLELRHESTSVREFTSAAIASQDSYKYGRFRATLRPAPGPGLITGLFLHRNGPRQEIDIEFLGKDTTKMLVNVYYNPGPEGTKLEYGYRGTPTVINLGFDAAADFHTYEIDWQPDLIRWLVDDELVYERSLWNPTPIPDQPLELNINLWTSRSTEFAGQLQTNDLPVSAAVLAIEIESVREPEI